MNRKLNTLLFILGATLVLMVLTIGLFMVLFLLFVKVLLPGLSPDSLGWALPVIFLVAMALSIILYRIIIKSVFSRIRAERYFDHLFKPKK